MEAALQSMVSGAKEAHNVKACMQLMSIYVKNIVENPETPKYRKIKISNSKFSGLIWSHEEARTVFLLAGFEQEGEFLILPPEVNLRGLQSLLLKCLGTFDDSHGQCSSDASSSFTKKTTTRQTEVPHLKLGNTAKDTTLFYDEVKPDMTLLSYLIEMGYRQDMAWKALSCTRNKGVQPAMDWIDAHVDEFVGKEKGPQQHALSSLPSDLKEDHNREASSCSSLTTMQGTEPSSIKAPTSRYQKVADERHKFQERQRLEAITAAREAKREDRKHKENLRRIMQEDRDDTNEKFERQKLARQDHSDCAEACWTNRDGNPSHEARDEASNSATDYLPETTNDPNAEHARIRVHLLDGKDLNLDVKRTLLIEDLYRLVADASSLAIETFVLSIPFPPMELTDMSIKVAEAALAPSSTLMMKLKKSERKPFEDTEDLGMQTSDTIKESESGGTQCLE